MKYLLLGLICLSLQWPHSANTGPTGDGKTSWVKGDVMSVNLICKDEETILDIVNSDMISFEHAMLEINHKISENVCITPNRNGSSFSVIVLEALVHYVDYKGDKNVVLSVKNMAGTFLGWVVGVGIFVEGGMEI